MFCGYCGKENADNYSYCTGCGEALEKESPIQAVQPEDSSENQTTLSQENQETENSEKKVPRSNYISVRWWKDCEWPWQARSLDGENLLGNYGTELEAAEVVAKFHGIDVIDLLVGKHLTETEIEERRRLLIERLLERTNITSEQSMPPEVASEDYLSFDSPQVACLSEFSNTPMPIYDEQDLSQKKTPPTGANISEKIKEAVEGHKYYVDQFIPFYETGKGIKSWNWAAFLVGPIWFLYRKVFSLFFIGLFFYSIAYWAEQVNAPELFQLITSLSVLAAWIYCTVKSNKTYYDNVLRKIEGRENRLNGMLKIPAIILFISAFWSWASYDGYLNTVEAFLPMLNLKGALGQAGNWLIVCIQGALGFFLWELSGDKNRD